MDRDGSRSLRDRKGKGPLERRVHHCAQSAERRKAGPRQSAWDLCNSSKLVKGSVNGVPRMQRQQILTGIIALGVASIISAQEQPSAGPNTSARLEETKSAGTEVRKDLFSKPDVPLSQPAIEPFV